jgi:TolB-like protein/class 3 adenylate cyclase/cytochrome c-type biogenesis protein CcmH/NrfG
MKGSRQLAAIMFTDIEGYTALMQNNEKKAIQTREKHRQIFNSVTEKHNGRVLQYYGDGTLSIFDSAIDAVICGIEMQLDFQKDPFIPVRIGIHTGDIIFSEEEIIGDGVNVASRIESLAVPGSIFISEKVYDEIKNQESISTSRLKTFKLKNVEKPVEVYAISNVGLIVPKPEDLESRIDADLSSLPKNQGKSKSKTQKRVTLAITITILIALLLFVYLRFGPTSGSSSDNLEKSIAVLAFENMSNDPDQEYFSDGISEEILNALTHVEGLKVAGRTSAFAFKGQHEDVRTIGNKLDVKMVLEGSVRKAGTKVRITAQLVNVEDGFHIWSETYDREMEDIFAIQDEIATNIVEKLKLQVQKSAKGTEWTPDVDAYDLLLKGIYFLDKDYEGAKKAMEYFQKAVEVDPDYAEAYALIGEAYNNYAGFGLMPGAEAVSKARTAAQKAISLNEQEPMAHKVLAYIHLNYDWDWEAALSEYNKALQYGLGDPDHFITFYDIFINQDYEHAIHVSEQIIENDPFDMQNHWHLGVCNLYAGRFEEALTAFDNALELDPNYSEGQRWKGVTLIFMEKYEDAIYSLEKTLEITHGEGPANFELLVAKMLMSSKEEALQLLKDWESSGVPIDPGGPAILYALLEMQDNAMAELEKCYQERSGIMLTLKFHSMWDPYRDDPRFIEIYDKMNFPE